MPAAPASTSCGCLDLIYPPNSLQTAPALPDLRNLAIVQCMDALLVVQGTEAPWSVGRSDLWLLLSRRRWCGRFRSASRQRTHGITHPQTNWTCALTDKTGCTHRQAFPRQVTAAIGTAAGVQRPLLHQDINITTPTLKAPTQLVARYTRKISETVHAWSDHISQSTQHTPARSCHSSSLAVCRHQPTAPCSQHMVRVSFRCPFSWSHMQPAHRSTAGVQAPCDACLQTSTPLLVPVACLFKNLQGWLCTGQVDNSDLLA
jgi:hypothetical protein